ncbi:hypothetical protein [Leifsonia poae]|uniref:hypothetical protein n=1 Tax=Leifsonia poae TaxID=110933 RepID=UPI003D668B38
MSETAYIRRSGAARRRSATVLVALVAVVILSGCAAGGAAQPTTPPASALATATPAAVKAAVKCGDLLSDSDVQKLVGSEIVTVNPNLAAASGKKFGWRDGYAIEAVQGANCVWGEPGAEWTALIPLNGEPLFALQALPHAKAAWTELRPASGASGAAYTGGESYGGSCGGGVCHTDVLVGEWWLSADASSSNASLTERGFHNEVQKAVTALGTLPVPPAESVHNPIADACGSDAYTAAVKQSFAVPEASSFGRETQFGIGSAIQLATASGGCNYQPSNDGSGGSLMSAFVIPDAKALFAEFAQLAGQSTSTEFGRTTMNDNADTATSEYYALVGNDWVTIYAQPEPDSESHSKTFIDWLRATYA